MGYWDNTDPATGLSIGCKTACEIIDGLNHQQLQLFNAPRKDNAYITAGELIERYIASNRESITLDNTKHEASNYHNHLVENAEKVAAADEVSKTPEEMKDVTKIQEGGRLQTTKKMTGRGGCIQPETHVEKFVGKGRKLLGRPTIEHGP